MHTNAKFTGEVNCWISTYSLRIVIKNLNYRTPPMFVVKWHQYKCHMKLQHVYYKPRNTRWDATTLVYSHSSALLIGHLKVRDKNSNFYPQLEFMAPTSFIYMALCICQWDKCVRFICILLTIWFNGSRSSDIAVKQKIKEQEKMQVDLHRKIARRY
jgi:hypothetical protein